MKNNARYQYIIVLAIMLTLLVVIWLYFNYKIAQIN